jgi:hypothetical protein
MKTELKGSFRSGFKVTEKDFRRIIELIAEKIRSAPDQRLIKKLTYKLANGAIVSTEETDDWPAPGSEDTKLGVLMELEVRHGEAEVHARV